MKIGTDFSGIGSPEMALKYLGIDFKSVFACEIDKYARQSFEKLHKPQTFYNDITTRNHKEVEQLDLYVAGFPCQSFSMAGKRKGFEETRGTLFFNVAEFIKENQPKTFILENVKGLLNHDKGKTFQTIVDILSNGGGTQNGQISLDIFEDGLGYNIYWKVLNTKNYGIPQNRERIFIVGFKDFRDFNFPKEIPLESKLGDMLQDNPDSKYYLSDKVVKRIEDNLKEKDKENKNYQIRTHYLGGRKGDNKKGGTGHLCKTDETSYCLDTGNSQAIEVLKEVRTEEAKNKRKETGTNDFRDKKIEWRRQDYSNTITTSLTNDHFIKQSQAIEIKRLPDLKIKVSKRANDTPKEINQYLKDNKKRTIKEISLYLDLPKTQVEHYFRTDKYRAIPSPEVWIKLKELLNLNSKYDKQVTEINQTIGTYESANRLYDTDGISPTLQTQEQGYYKTKNKIRRLTPLECWRLQGFKDKDFFSVTDVSDTQLYKQAGNSITVNVLMEIFKKIYDNNK